MKYGNAVFAWLPLAAAITGMCLLLSIAVQQNYRQTLNDPQIQMAEDSASALANGAPVSFVIGNAPPIDIAQSLAPWVTVYDANGTPIGSSGLLNGAQPKVPQGVFGAAADNAGKDTDISGQNRITWQAQDGTRSAIVVQHYTGKSNGFVIAGRNMREVENREQRLGTLVTLAWMVLMLATFVLQMIAVSLYKR